jgi:hypothetical protein
LTKNATQCSINQQIFPLNPRKISIRTAQAAAAFSTSRLTSIKTLQQFNNKISWKLLLFPLPVGLCLLFFQNATTVSSQCLSIQRYGGTGDGVADNAPAIQRAINTLPRNGGCISFPPGKFAISKKIDYVLPARNFSISLLGSGGDSTILFWPTANAGLSFTYNYMGNSIHIRDMSLTVGVAGGPNAIHLIQNYQTPGSTGYNAFSDFTGITIRGDDAFTNDATLNAQDYWNVGLNISGVSNINVQSASFEGPYAGGYAKQGVGIQVSGAATSSGDVIYAGVLNIVASSFNSIGIGLVYGSNAQGLSISNGNFTGGQYGILTVPNEPGVDQLVIANSQFNVSVAGIYTQTAIPGLSVATSLFLMPIGSIGVNLSRSGRASISGNTFQSIIPDSPDSHTNSNGIIVNNSELGGTVITGNQFSQLTTAIWLQAQSTKVNVQANSYDGDTNTVVNQGAGKGNTVGGGSP